MQPRHVAHHLRASSDRSIHHALLTAAVAAALGAAAQAQQQFAELARLGLPNNGAFTWAVALGDVDGDGDLDVVTGTFGQNRLYLNSGMGGFTDVTANRMPTDSDGTFAIALGDVDGDGDLDLVAGNVFGQDRLYLNDGTGTFSDATLSHMPVDSDPTRTVAFGDVDGDGDLDMVSGSESSTSYSSFNRHSRLYLNDGSGSFSDATGSQMPQYWMGVYSVALGDVDGDGDLDLLLGSDASFYTTGQNRLYLNDGAGTFSDATASRMPVVYDYTEAVAWGDVDGDGDLDAVIGNLGQNRLYLNDGTGTFSDATASQLPADNDFTYSFLLGDVDGDGDLDLVVGNAGPGQNRLYLNDGAGTFTDATAARVPLGNDDTTSMGLGDVDRDGDLDLVVGITGAANHVYFNLQRQLHAPAAPQIGQLYGLDAYLRYGPASTADLAAIYLSTAPASIPLGALGTLGIDLNQAAPFPTLIIPQPAGVASVGFTVPNVPGLIGQAIYSQAMLVAYPNDLRLSNVVRDVIQ